jgi:hypothetical protein
VRFDPEAVTARRLAHRLLVHETGRAVDRTAAGVADGRDGGTGPGSKGGRDARAAGSSPTMVTDGPFVPFGPAPGDDPSSGTGPPERPLPPWDPAAPIGDPGAEPEDDPDDDEHEDDPEDDEPDEAPPERPSHPPRGLLGGCVAAAGLCCTGQVCCADEFVGPWSGQPRSSWCGTCADGCECGCDCCDCCSDCDGCCDCDCGS